MVDLVQALVDDGFQAVRLGDGGSSAPRTRRGADIQRDGPVRRDRGGNGGRLPVAALGEPVVDTTLRLAGGIAGRLGVSQQQEARYCHVSSRNACTMGWLRTSSAVAGSEPGATSEP